VSRRLQPIIQILGFVVFLNLDEFGRQLVLQVILFHNVANFILTNIGALTEHMIVGQVITRLYAVELRIHNQLLVEIVVLV
jgi:hypothetical protein